MAVTPQDFLQQAPAPFSFALTLFKRKQGKFSPLYTLKRCHWGVLVTTFTKSRVERRKGIGSTSFLSRRTGKPFVQCRHDLTPPQGHSVAVRVSEDRHIFFPVTFPRKGISIYWLYASLSTAIQVRKGDGSEQG